MTLSASGAWGNCDVTYRKLIILFTSRTITSASHIHGETVDETPNFYKLLKGLSLLESVLLTSRLWSCAHEIKIA